MLNTSKERLEHIMLQRIVTEHIHDLGIAANVKGHDYIREAIVLVIKDKGSLHLLTKVIYPTIAKKFNTTPSRVERAIRHAIEVSCYRCPADVINEVFRATVRADKGKPTNAEFIAMIADKIALDIELESIYNLYKNTSN